MDIFNRKLEEEIRENEKELKELEDIIRENKMLQEYTGEFRVIKKTESLEEIIKHDGEHPETFLTKIPTLDKAIGGFRKGQLVVVSAPTGQGKTSFCQTLTENFYLQGYKCLWFTFEVPLVEFVEKFKDAPEFYVPRRLKESNLEWLDLRMREAITKYGTEIIFIDHLHFLLDFKMLARATNTSTLIGMIMRELKKFALRYNVMIFLVTHLKKTRIEDDPNIDDLRDSSFIAQESDVVMIMWRDKQKDSSAAGGWRYTNKAKLLITKNRRTGKLGYINLVYNENKFSEEAIEEQNYGE